MESPSQESQAKLFDIAQSQGGYFTAAQAEGAGFIRTNHAYHVKAGNWVREYRGIFRLAHFPMPERSDLILWSLWSRNRDGLPQGVYSHQTALSIYDLSDLMPAKLHMTVPESFRKNSALPDILILHYGNLPAEDIVEREGFRVTRPIRTMMDLERSGELSNDQLLQAFSEARKQGLITEADIKAHRDQLPTYLTASRKKKVSAS